MNLLGYFPCVIRSYDAEKRTVRLEIPGITNGADELPESILMKPVGDKHHHCEHRILEGDLGWCVFLNGGDPRYPLLVGYRDPQVGNVVGWRRYHHDNYQIDADDEVIINAGSKIKLNVGGTIYEMTPDGITVTTPALDIVKT